MWGISPLPANVLGDANALLNTLTDIYAASEISSANKTATESEKSTARKALKKELFPTLLFLAAQFPGQPEDAALYMRQTLLENPATPEQPENPGPPVG